MLAKLGVKESSHLDQIADQVGMPLQIANIGMANDICTNAVVNDVNHAWLSPSFFQETNLLSKWEEAREGGVSKVFVPDCYNSFAFEQPPDCVGTVRVPHCSPVGKRIELHVIGKYCMKPSQRHSLTCCQLLLVKTCSDHSLGVEINVDLKEFGVM
jgi:hypothetical protein